MATSIFHDAGIDWLFDVWRGQVAAPANLYLGLRTLDGVSGHPSDAASADTLTSNLQEVPATISAVSTTYARIAVTYNTTNLARTANGHIRLITLPQETFTFSMSSTAANVNGITHAFLATTADTSGILIASAALATTYNVANGSQLAITFQIQGRTG